MNREDFVKKKVKELKSTKINQASEILRQEFSTLRSLYKLANKVLTRNQLSVNIDKLIVTSDKVEHFELFGCREYGKIIFNSNLADSITKEIIETLREARKSFKEDNIEKVRKHFVERLDFDATYKDKKELAKILFQSYKDLDIDEVYEDKDLDKILTLENVYGNKVKIKTILGMSEYTEPVVEKPSRFSWK
ncbi:hypothetical protein HNS38_11280 [Lentimicrobium sp. L6]|uniref:hypothetical protein n=1 Tax=Lentimicrobium sp. L6 TaxID=2735916 RepID=UPI001556C2EC|nr:hypothetical protein [Lentimicrobium sp. L6]NPD85347.1 hypothetical protein [Lentimicrobium sp. L6]